MFKNDEYFFSPTNDLVKSMPFDFVNGLKDGKWTKLDNKWKIDVKKALKQAVSNSIKAVAFVRTMKKDYTFGMECNMLNKDSDPIYQVTMDNDDQTTFYVNYAQIMDIIGEEEWMKEELNCICNIASSRTVSLTWGAKKKSSNWSQLSIGDDVIVSNHGKKWEHHAKILQMNDDGISVLIKWGSSLKKEHVFINDCRIFDVEKIDPRKQKNTDFFTPMPDEEYLRKRKGGRSEDKLFAPMAAEEIVQESEPDIRPICADGQMNNIFFNPDNSSKQCAQGAIANLLNMLQCSKEALDLFWHLANSDMDIIEKHFVNRCQRK